MAEQVTAVIRTDNSFTVKVANGDAVIVPAVSENIVVSVAIGTIGIPTGAIVITSSQVSDFTEAVQDAAFATAMTDSSSIDFSYNDGANTWTGVVLPAGVDHGSIAGLGDDDHTQYHNDARGDARYFTEAEHLNISAGAGDAGKPIKLDAAGHVDATMINDADISHSATSGYVANEHIDWTQSGAGTIHASNYVDNSITDHNLLSNIGTNAHSVIDSHLASTTNPHAVTAAQVGAPGLQTMTDEAILRADGTAGQYQNSLVTIGDTGVISARNINPQADYTYELGTIALAWSSIAVNNIISGLIDDLYINTNGVTSGTSPQIFLKTGLGNPGNSGQATLGSGNAGVGNSGLALIESGSVATGTSGNAVLRSGLVFTSGSSGAILVQSGVVQLGAGNSGDLNFGSGANTGTGNSGAVNFTTGNVVGAAVPGPITFSPGIDGSSQSHNVSFFGNSAVLPSRAADPTVRIVEGGIYYNNGTKRYKFHNGTSYINFVSGDTAVTPAAYGSTSSVGTFTVDQEGRITAAANATITPASIGAPALVGTSTDNAIVRFDLAAGLQQNSLVTIDDTGNMALVAGAVGAPSLYLGTDTTTGLYRTAANEWGFAVSGVNKLTLGTTNLTVVPDMTLQARLLLPIASSGTVGGIYSNGSALLINPLDNNVFLGKTVGNLTLSGTLNVGVGNGSLAALTSGTKNTAIGSNVLTLLQTGGSNVAIGADILQNSTAGSNNVAIGVGAARYTTGSNNFALGTNALLNNVTGASNVAMGVDALRNATGSLSVGIGLEALYTVTSGTFNVAIGAYAGRHTTGGFNMLIGSSSGTGVSGSSTFQDSVGVGYQTLFGATTGSFNVAVGTQAMRNVTTGSSNMGIGRLALFNVGAGANNCVVGSGGGQYITGSFNVAIGNGAYFGRIGGGTTGRWNSIIGFSAMGNIGDGERNVSIGSYSGQHLNNGSDNVFIGYNAGRNQSGGGFDNSRNVFIGAFAGNVCTTGTNNVCIGQSSGSNLGSGTGNVLLGYLAGSNETGSNNLYIANTNTATPLIYGDFSNGFLEVTGKTYLGAKTTPTAVLHLSAGTATANTGPLKFTSGVHLTTPEAGVAEFNGTNFFLTPVAARYPIALIGDATKWTATTYTQTYATASATHAALTSATLTDSTTGTADTTVADVTAAHDQTILNNNFADLTAQCNALRADLENTKQVLNQVIDNLQTISAVT